MPTNLPLKEMTLEEKLAAMESLWEDLARSPEAVESPAWEVMHGYHRSLSKRFPFAIYYSVERDLVRVHAVLDCRRNPSWIRKRLKEND